MAHLKKMSIQGIRSFAPDDPQKITFQTPFTLILGPNGAGKTTIIECLKYSTIGELPPGSKTGGCFVHDPKLLHEYEVKAKVMLKFADINGMEMSISRSLVATQKPKAAQVSIRTLDGQITRIDQHGRRTNISSKCAELDQEMVSSLGVSKSVLESVIFCHQDDADWPLSEGKSVRQRFDDLFESTQYVKALETIRKLKAEQANNLKCQKIALQNFTEKKNMAVKLKDDLEVKQICLKTQEDSLKNLAQKLTPVQEELSQYREKNIELLQMQSSLQSLKKEKASLEITISELTSNIQNPFEGTTDELQTAIESADIRLAEIPYSLKNLENQINLCQHEANGISREIQTLLVDKGHLESEKKQSQLLVDKCKLLVKENASKWNLLNTEHFDNFVIDLGRLVRENETKLIELKEEFDLKEKDTLIDLDSKKSKLTMLQQEINSKAESKSQNLRKLDRIRSGMEEATETAKQLSDFRGRLLMVEKQLDCDTHMYDIDKMQHELKTSTEELKSLEHELTNLDSELSDLHKTAAIRIGLEHLQTEKHNKEEHLRKIRNQHMEVLEQLFAPEEVPKVHLRRAFDAKLKALETENQQKVRETQKLNHEISQLEVSVNYLQKELETTENRVKAHESQLARVCGSADLVVTLEKLTLKRKKAEDERATIQGNLVTFKRFIERLEKENPPCPLCHRDFDKQNDVTELIEELQSKIAKAPADLTRKELELSDLNAKYQELVRLQPIADEVANLRNKQLPKVKQDLEEKQQLLDAKKMDCETIHALLDNFKCDEQLAQSIQGDMAVADRQEKEMLELENKLICQRNILGADVISSRSVNTVQREKDALQCEIRQLQNVIHDKRQSLETITLQLHRLRTEQNQLKETILKIEASLQERAQHEAEVARLNKENSELNDAIADLRVQVQPWTSQLEDCEKKRQQFLEERDLTLDRERSKINLMKQSLQEVCSAIHDTQSLKKENISEKLLSAVTQLEQKQLDYKEKKKQIDQLTIEIDLKKKQISEHKIYHRELNDILKMRQTQIQLALMETRIQELNSQLRGMHFGNVEEESARLEAQENELLKQKQQFIFKRNEFETEIRQLQKHLIENYATAEQDYISQFYDVQILLAAIDDLGSYYKALDEAIMRFHHEKMSEINKIIKELWTNTYKGNDIDHIEIRSDEDKSENLSKARRTYNYRVVMVRTAGGNGSTVLDMRGRCSAGQKVLACLIIRLALAEVFCIKCGVLALDEPTTNLDNDNIESLAAALIDIIKVRSQQNNFQLIVITHDQGFVERLGHSEMVEDFYSVSRNANGYSQIKRKSIFDSKDYD